MHRRASTHPGAPTLLLAALITLLLAALVTLPSALLADGDPPADDSVGVEHVATAAGKAALQTGPRGLVHPPPLPAAVLPDTVGSAAPGAVGSVQWPGAEPLVSPPAPSRWGRAPPVAGTVG